jgi:uncharacterized protein YjeT (DUF2065 family)
MRVIAYLLGFGIIAFSSFLILYTRATTDALNGMAQKYPIRYLAVPPAVVGILFLIAAPATVYPWLFRIVGLLAIVKALLAYINPNNIARRALEWYFVKTSDQAQRLYGIVGVIFGTAILSWIL